MAVGLPLENYLINPRLQEASPAELADWLLGDTPDSQAARMEAPKADQEAILRSMNNLKSMQITQLADRITHTFIACIWSE